MLPSRFVLFVVIAAALLVAPLALQWPTPAVAVADDGGVKGVGSAAPGFRLKDTDGKDITDDAWRTKTYAVAFISTRNDACRRTCALLLERLAANPALQVLAVVCDPDRSAAGGSTPEVAAREFKQAVIGNGGPRDRFVVCAATELVRRQWGEKVATGGGPLKIVPTVVTVDADGRIRHVFEGEPTAAELANALGK